jgi:hypothetical protein
MKSAYALAIATGIALATLNAGCAGDASSDDSTSEDGVKGDYADPGKDLGRASHVIADVEGEAAFVVYDRAVERRAANGTVESLGKVDGGFENLVVSKKFVAFLTASFVNGGGSHVLVHVLSRAEGWKEVRTEDLSTPSATFRHAIAFIDDDTLAVGSGDKVVLLLASDGTRSYAGGYNSKFRADEVFSIFPSGDASHFYTALDNGEVYDVDAKTKAITLQPAREGTGAIDIHFDPSTQTWVTVDFEGLKLYGLDGKLARRVDLVTAKSRYISASALLGGGKLLVAHQSESSQERSVLATYDLKSMKRYEIGTFDGMVDQLGPSGTQLFFAFSPKGAAGFNSRVWYAHSRKM